jgi:hypothetical protein
MKKSIYLLHKCRTISVDLKPSSVYRRLANRHADGRSTDLLTVSEATGTINIITDIHIYIVEKNAHNRILLCK